MVENIKARLFKIRTINLMLTPGVLSLIPLVLVLLISGGHYSNTPVENFLIMSILFLWGFIGLPIVIRKEAPGLIRVHGTLAIVQGVLIMVGFWLPLVFVLIGMFFKAPDDFAVLMMYSTKICAAS